MSNFSAKMLEERFHVKTVNEDDQIQHIIEKTNSDLEDTFLRLGLIDERYYQGSDLCIDLDRYWIYYIFYG